MIYGKYRGLRNAAWKTLLDFNVKELPVRVIAIAKAAGIRIIENNSVQELSDEQMGLSIFDGQQWYIIFDDSMKDTRIRFTIAHELGHIFCGHSMKDGFHARQYIGLHPEDEQEANKYAIGLLAPACVLWGLDLHTPTEISSFCNISYSSAMWRAKRMEELYRRNKFLVSPIEQQVYKQFKPFIEQNKKQI